VSTGERQGRRNQLIISATLHAAVAAGVPGAIGWSVVQRALIARRWTNRTALDKERR